MYIEPQQYKCLKCGHIFDYSPDRDHKFPVFEEEERTDRGIIHRDLPVCPKCFEEFIRKNVGVGYGTVPFRKEGSDYEVATKRAKPLKEIDDTERLHWIMTNFSYGLIDQCVRHVLSVGRVGDLSVIRAFLDPLIRKSRDEAAKAVG